MGYFGAFCTTEVARAFLTRQAAVDPQTEEPT